jgi:hypothetical protein
MAIVQISKIQQRRGLNQDLPTLSSAELGWSIDTQQLYIGNGDTTEGAPKLGRTEILTEHSIVNYTNSLSGNITALESNVAILQSQVVVLQNRIGIPTSVNLSAASSGLITNTTANNGVMSYTLTQGSYQRTGQIKFSRRSSTVNYDEDYTETGTTDTVFSVTGNATQSNIAYTTTSSSTLIYQITSF